MNRRYESLCDRLIAMSCVQWINGGPHWIWLGAKVYSRNGTYGKLMVRGDDGKLVTWLAHRLAQREFNGSLDPRKVVMHACDIKLCINPACLSQGTQVENCADSLRKRNKRKHRSRRSWM